MADQNFFFYYLSLRCTNVILHGDILIICSPAMDFVQQRNSNFFYFAYIFIKNALYKYEYMQCMIKYIHEKKETSVFYRQPNFLRILYD